MPSCASFTGMRFAVALVLRFHVSVASSSPGFLLISAPRMGKVSWVHLPDDETFTDERKPRVLIDTGLQHPQGIAVDQKMKRLYVADPDAREIYRYDLDFTNDGLRVKEGRTVVSKDTESRWVAVDGNGNVFFSDEPRNLILKIDAEQAGLRGSTEATPVAEPIYAGTSMVEVNEPGGVAVDNLHIFWTNKHFGTEVGSVIRGDANAPATSTTPGTVTGLAKNVEKSYGICHALDNVYYTAADTYIYGVKVRGGPITEVGSVFKNPRGCAWDNDGTVYVADRGANAVYSFAGNMPTIEPATISKVFDAEDAFGLAVVVRPNARSGSSKESFFGSVVSALKEKLR